MTVLLLALIALAVLAPLYRSGGCGALPKGNARGASDARPGRRHDRAGRHGDQAAGAAAPEGDEPGGAEATAAMRALVEGRRLRCELNGERTHDRCAGVCFLAGLDIAEALVRRGLARDCPRFSAGHYARVERQAVADGATIGGIYALPSYCRDQR